MILLTWNVCRHANSANWRELQRGLKVDLLLLQESPELATEPGVLWKRVPGYNWGSAIVTTNGLIEPIAIAGYAGWVIGGEVRDGFATTDSRPLFAFSLHAPTSSKSAPRRSYTAEVISIVREIQKQVPHECDCVIAGDFNFRSLGERAAGESLCTTAKEREALRWLSAAGLVSCWSAVHPHTPLAQTLQWSKDKTVPYHCDGILVPPSWTHRARCEVLSSAVAEHSSDHFPVIAWTSV